MVKETRVFIDQYNQVFYARTIRELREQIPGRCSKMYVEHKDGSTWCAGYVIGKHWLRMFKQDKYKI